MKISILLPYKENFSPIFSGAVSIFLNAVSKKVNIVNLLLFMEAHHLKKNFQLSTRIFQYLKKF